MASFSKVLALALATAVVLSSRGWPQEVDGVEVHSTITYYDVAGSTWAEVRRSMDIRRPTLSGTSERWDGVTSWRFNVRQPVVAPGQCRAHAAMITLEVLVSMPRLEEGYELSVEDQTRWARMERRLTAHEEGHVQIARDGARRMIAAARRATCGDLKQILEAEHAQLSARQAAYDRVTKHGVEQDAWEN